jgi:RNA polymerase sigma factor (sigma-70 family)
VGRCARIVVGWPEVMRVPLEKWWLDSDKVPGGWGAVGEGDAFVATGALPAGEGAADDALVDLVPMLRRVVGARVKDPHTVDDLVQETLVRVMAARSRVEPDKLPHYASVTARNLIASMAEKNDRARSRSHLLVEAGDGESPVTDVLRQEERAIVNAALAKLPAGDRDVLMAHEVDGQDTISMAAGRGSTPGAVAARLSRARASLRVEYLLLAEGIEPPTDRCRPVLRALSSGDRRRQRELDVNGHILGCAACARIKAELFERRDEQTTDGVVRVSVSRDADVVVARQQGREIAALVGFSSTDQTRIATAISEVTRNIVKFAERGEVVISMVSAGARRGVNVVARDVGPGIENIQEAMEDGFSTYDGFGLGLPGTKRLMDRFDLESIPGEGTTVTMEKWLP